MNIEDRDSLHPELQRRFELLDDVPERDIMASEEAKRAFLAQAGRLRERKSTHQPVSLAFPLRLKGWMRDLQAQINTLRHQRKERYAMFATLTAIIVAIGILFGGAGATAYAAQGSLPDDGLYEVKLFLEDLRLDLTGNPQEQLDLALDFSNERIQEMQGLANEGEPVEPRLATRYQEQLNYALQLAAQFDDESMVKAAQQIRSTLQQHERIMTKLMTNAPDTVDPALNQIREMVRERIRMVDSGLENPLQLRQALQQQLRSQENMPGETPMGNQEPGNGEPGPGPGGDMPDNDGMGPGPGTGPGPGPNENPGDSSPGPSGPNNPNEPEGNQNGEPEGPGAPDDHDNGSGNGNDSGNGSEDPQPPADPSKKDSSNDKNNGAGDTKGK